MADSNQRRQLLRRIAAFILSFLIFALLLYPLIVIIFHPNKPHFTLRDAIVSDFNLSSTGATSNTLTLAMQATLAAFNPNYYTGIYYHDLHAYTSYSGQQISLATELPATYQSIRDIAGWSTYLYAAAVPLPPFLLEVLRKEQSSGAVLVNVEVNGMMWTWASGWYPIYVNCPAYIRLAGAAAPAVKLQQRCAVNAYYSSN